jgi:hypothetical protein
MKKALCALLGLSTAAFAAVGNSADLLSDQRGPHARGLEAQRAEQENRRSVIISRLPNVERVNGAEPMVMSDLDLDAITAAGVSVDVGSMAAAIGDVAAVGTDADTVALRTEHLAMGIGTTVGEALACCGENADVDVGSAVVGSGDIVHGVTHEIEHDGPAWAHGFSVGIVVAVSFENLPAKLKGFAHRAGRFPH